MAETEVGSLQVETTLLTGTHSFLEEGRPLSTLPTTRETLTVLGPVTWGAWAAGATLSQSCLPGTGAVRRRQARAAVAKETQEKGLARMSYIHCQVCGVLPLLLPWPVGMSHTPAWVC